MRFSMCTTWGKAQPLEDIISIAASMQLNGVEIWDGHIDDYLRRNKGGMESLKAILLQNKLVCCAVSPYFNFLDKEKYKESIVCAKKCAQYARELKCGIIRTFLGDSPSAGLNEEQKSKCVEGLRSITQMVENDDICFALETHNGQPTDSVDFILFLIDQCKSSHLKVLFDGFNFYADGMDMMQAYDKLEEYTVHYHMKNYLWQQRIPTALQKGDVDYKELFLRLKKNEYRSFISFEYFCKQPQQIIGDSIKWAKCILTNNDN